MLTTLQAGRALASIAVVVFHANDYFLPEKLYGGQDAGLFLNAGYAGVEYFFMLSGFIMMLIHRADLGRPERALSFLRKRFVRIFPFYWLVLFALAALYALAPGLGPDNARDPLALILSTLLIPSLEPFVIVVAWTLSHEVLFYLLFSLAILDRRIGALVLGAWGLGIVVAAPFDLVFPLSFILSPYNLLFLIGMGCALAFRRVTVPAGWGLTVGGLVGFCAVAIADATGIWSPDLFVRTVLFGGTGAALVCGLAGLESRGALKAPAWLSFLGDASYAIYIVHGTILAGASLVLARLGMGLVLPPALGLAVLVGLAVIGGAAIHILAEKPLLHTLRTGRLPMPAARPIRL